MLSYMKRYKFQNFLIIMELLFQNLLLLGSTLLTMRMARLVMDGDFRGIIICSILVILLYLVLHLLFWAYDVHTTKVIACMNQDMRAALNRQMLGKHMQELAETDTGEYLSRYTNDLKEAETQGFRNLYAAADAVIKLVIGIVTLAWIQWKLLLCTLLTTGMVYVISHRFHGNVEEESEKVSKGWERFTQAVKEQVGGVRVLKYFGHQNDFKDRIQAESEELEKQRCRYVKSQGKAALKTKGINALAGLVNNLVLFGMCALRIIPAEIFFGGGNLTNQVKESIMSLAEKKIALAGAKPYFEKIDRTVGEESDKKALPAVREGIEIKNLSFSYPGHPIFDNLDLKFHTGGKYAVIGKSGSGKTTLLKLLLGQLETYQGEIRFDGIDASSYDPQTFYEQMAYIEQNVFLFHSTIRDNITLGREFSEEELETALKRSALSEDMHRFPQGLDTDVGENGRNLSGGQRQRIAVARALIYNRRILIVDEGTSALDRENAKAIEDALLKDPNVTLILVSHHLEEEDMKQYTDVYRLGEKVQA